MLVIFIPHFQGSEVTAFADTKYKTIQCIFVFPP
jgi:hypothetical protein